MRTGVRGSRDFWCDSGSPRSRLGAGGSLGWRHAGGLEARPARPVTFPPCRDARHLPKHMLATGGLQGGRLRRHPLSVRRDSRIAGDHWNSPREVVARRPGERKPAHGIKRGFEFAEKMRGNGLRGFGGEISPNLGQVGFRRLGQTERERLSNSFLPRSMMRPASKSRTRPAATSASPLSISAFSAASS